MAEGQPLRDESTGQGKKIWEEVDRAAAQVPDWIVERFKRAAEKRASKENKPAPNSDKKD
jgi:hypothetical protein